MMQIKQDSKLHFELGHLLYALGMDVRLHHSQTVKTNITPFEGQRSIQNGIKHAKHIIDYYIDILVKEGLIRINLKVCRKEVLPYMLRS